MERWCEWLVDVHLAEVVEAGAARAELVQLDGELAAEARYVFASRAAFDEYERDHAPRLREDGLQRFPIALGLRYERSTGDILARAE